MTTTITATQATSTDHAVSVATAADTLGVSGATVRRLLTPSSAKLARLGDGVSLDSVTAYANTRKANEARKNLTLSKLSDVELAAQAWIESRRLMALAKELENQARPVLEAAGAGLHGRFEIRLTNGRKITDSKAVNAHYEEIGQEVPKATSAGSFKVTRVA